MEDFNEYSKHTAGGFGEAPAGLLGLVNELAGRFDGKDKNELLKAVYAEARKNKKNGTLSNGDIDNFAAMLAPVLDDKKRKMLDKIVAELKRI